MLDERVQSIICCHIGDRVRYIGNRCHIDDQVTRRAVVVPYRATKERLQTYLSFGQDKLVAYLRSDTNAESRQSRLVASR